MDANTTITVGFVIALLGAILTVYNLNSSHKKDIQANDDILNEIKTSVLKANMKLDQQCGQLTNMEAEIKSTRKDIEQMRENQIKHDMEIKAIWKKLDKIKVDE